MFSYASRKQAKDNQERIWGSSHFVIGITTAYDGGIVFPRQITCMAAWFELYVWIEDRRQYWQQAAFCRVVDRPPQVILDACSDRTTEGTVWEECPCACADREDLEIHCKRSESDWDHNTPGVYSITYSCTDSAGQTTRKTRSLVVEELCKPPTDPKADPDGFCTNSQDNYTRSTDPNQCLLRCKPGSDPNLFALVCTSASDTVAESYWSTKAGGPEETPSCGSTFCFEPLVAFAKFREDPPLPTPCVESETNERAGNAGKVVSRGYCTPNCLVGYVVRPSSIENAGGRLTCDEQKGTLMPVQSFECKKAASKPAQLYSLDQRYVDMDVMWAPGAGHDCTSKAFDIQFLQVFAAPGLEGHRRF
jgi:hypothetical protein